MPAVRPRILIHITQPIGIDLFPTLNFGSRYEICLPLMSLALRKNDLDMTSNVRLGSGHWFSEK